MSGAATIALDMLAHAVSAVDVGGVADQVVLEHLGREWGLGAAAVVSVSPLPERAVRTTALWPDPDTAADLAALLTDRSTRLARTLTAGWEMTTLDPQAHARTRNVLYAVVPPSPSGPVRVGVGAGPARVAAFARATPFTNADLRIWEVAREPLAVLWSLVEHVGTGLTEVPSTAYVEPAVPEPMSRREVEVLQLLSEGRLATSIASELELSPRTVHRHLANIYRKLGVHDRMVAVNLAREHGLIRATAS